MIKLIQFLKKLNIKSVLKNYKNLFFKKMIIVFILFDFEILFKVFMNFFASMPNEFNSLSFLNDAYQIDSFVYNWQMDGDIFEKCMVTQYQPKFDESRREKN